MINNKITLSPVYTYAYCVNKDKGIDSQIHRKQHPSTQIHKMCIKTDVGTVTGKDKIRHLQFRQAFLEMTSESAIQIEGQNSCIFTSLYTHHLIRVVSA